MLFLILSFFAIALIYASVGFGGGSSYLALLVYQKVEITLVPLVALLCNLIVVTTGSINYLRNGIFRKDLLFPFLFFSIPFSYLGGRLQLSTYHLQLITFCTLFMISIKMLRGTHQSFIHSAKIPSLKIGILFGSLLGFLSGLVGIGGGIFLSPLLYYYQWGTPKEISATATLFIFFNSLAGLIGQFQKLNLQLHPPTLMNFWPLYLAVLFGGQLGSHLNIKKFSSIGIERITGLLILIISLYSLIRGPV